MTRDGRKKKKQAGAAAPTSASPEASHAPRRKTFALIVALAAALVAMAAGLAAVRWARPKRPNLLLVTIDTLRADHVGVYGAAAAQTPTLDGLARRGVMFRNAQTAIPLTGPSHATVMTGLYPPAHGVRDNVVFDLPASRKTLATLLHGQGYRTAAFVGAYPVAAAFGFRQGFDVFDESFHQNPVPGEGAERPANEVADAAIRWIEAGGAEPFFLWTHFYDPHAPYAPPPPFRESFHDHPYDGEIAFADAQVGRVLETLRAAGKLEGTVVAILSDHGESLGEHGEATHAVLVYESTLHVPWIVAGPQVPAGKQIAERVATVDVLPTLLGLLGLPAPPELLGRDLRPAFAGKRIPNDGLYAESLFGRLNCRWAALRSWTQGNWKLIDGGESELFDLAADPHESASLASKEPERMRQMQQALRAALQKMAPAGDSARPNPISAEQEERLRALGYTAGSGGAGAIDEPGLPDPRERVAIYERIQGQLRAPHGLDRALVEIKALCALDPGNPFAQFALASINYRAGRLLDADHAFARALELDPDRPNVRQQYGRLLRERGRLEASEHELRIVVEQQSPGETSARVGLAETLIDLGKTDEAGRLIDGVLEKDPKLGDALAAKGRLLRAQGRAGEAVDFLQRAAESGAPDPTIELGIALLDSGNPQGAGEAAGRILARTPAHPWALTILGESLIREGRREEGLQVLQRALAAPPRRVEVWQSLARAFKAAGDTPSAERCLREARALAG